MVEVIARNRERFVEICEENNVDLVLTGHTHRSVTYDADEKIYENFPISTKTSPTLYVQTDDNKQHVHYRNVTVTCNEILLHETVRINFEPDSTQRVRYINLVEKLVQIKAIFSLLK